MEIKLPELGENITSGGITEILVNPGDTVAKGENILQIETDKAVVDVPSPAAGTVVEILVKAGDDVSVGQAIFKFDTSGAPQSDETPAKQEEQKQEEQKQEEPEQSEEKPKAEAPKPAPAEQPTPDHTPKSNESIPAQKNVNASPSVRRFARELGVDLSGVTGSGPGGRISTEDVKAYVKSAFQSGGPAVSTGSVPAVKPLPSFDSYGETRREKMSKIRQVTAEHMSHCWNTIPHVTQFDKADVTSLDAFRQKISTKERKVTVTSFLIKVMAAALKKFPQFNSSIDMQTKEIIFKDFVHIGVAVDTPRGLIVPKLRNVDQKSIFEITDELVAMAGRAREGKIGLDELQGGSTTLTNLGGIGGHAFTPIVNWPEVAILGASRGNYEQLWDGKMFAPKLMLPLSLSYDQRLIDGADAARYLRFICEALEQPFLLEL